MRNIYTTTLRLNLNDPEERRAWEHLRNLNKKRYRSYSKAIVTAVNDYFDRQERLEADPYLETREREERFIQQIVDGVCESLKQTLPLFLAGCMTGLSAVQPTPAPAIQNSVAAMLSSEEKEEPEPEGIDWDFLGS